MSRSRRELGGSRRKRKTGASLAALLVLLVVLAAGAGPLQAQDIFEATWEPLSVPGPVTSLTMMNNERLFAWTLDSTLRSDDGGETWTPVDVPAGLRVQAVDPVDSSVLYAWGDDGLYRRAGDGAPWQPIYHVDPYPQRRSHAALAISPADHQVLYLSAMPGSFSGSGGTYTLVRSADSGVTWEAIDKGNPGNLCDWEFLILQAHPTDANRVFRSSGCLASRDDLYGVGLRESVDRGTTWNVTFAEKPYFPQEIQGGVGSNPARFYLTAVARSIEQGGTGTGLFRSDDGGATWTLKKKWCCSIEAHPGLAQDPAQPDHVFVAPASGGVQGSLDGGETWRVVGERGLTDVHVLAISPDGATLYAGAERGLFRLRLR